MKIEKVKINEIKLNPNNPRIIKDDKFKINIMLTPRPPHLENRQGNPIISAIGLAIMFIVMLVSVFLSMSMDDTQPQQDVIDLQSFEKGKFVGRNAMIVYCMEQHGELSIELNRLLAIEDSIQKSKDYKYEY